MDKIHQYRLLCSLTSPLRPYQKSSPEQILFTSRKIRLKLDGNTKNKKGGNDKKVAVLFINDYDNICDDDGDDKSDDKSDKSDKSDNKTKK